MSGLDVDNRALLTPAQLRAVGQAAVNRTLQRVRTFAARKTSERYALSAPTISRYIVLKRVTRASATVEGEVTLQVRPLPVTVFKPRVVLRSYTYAINGHVVTRRLATVDIQRLRGEGPQQVPGLFPLNQRRGGKLQAEQKVRRRIGADRDRLTSVRYTTFPRTFADGTLLPAVADFAPARTQIEFDAALRARTRPRGGAA